MSKKRKYQKDRKSKASKMENRLRVLEADNFALKICVIALNQNISEVESSEFSKEVKQTLLDTKDKVDNIYINQSEVTKALSNSIKAIKKAEEVQKETKVLHNITQNINSDIDRLDTTNTDIRAFTMKKYKELSTYIAKVENKTKFNIMIDIAVIVVMILNILVQIF